MFTTKLKRMPYAQAHIVHMDNGDAVLVSYATAVAMVDHEGWLTCNGLYSKTTRKHIGAFMREFNTPCDYYTAKWCYEHNVAENIYTGEIVERG